MVWESRLLAQNGQAELQAELQNSVGLIPVGGNSPSAGGWIV